MFLRIDLVNIIVELKCLKIDTFLGQQFRRTGHSPGDVTIEPVEKIIYDDTHSSRFKTIKRHETELKWIKLLQTPFPLEFNYNIYQEGNISKMPDLKKKLYRSPILPLKFCRKY